jgi:hypothetical protein
MDKQDGTQKSRSRADLAVQCTRCRNRHMESERTPMPLGNGLRSLVCPRCEGKSFYDLTPTVAWCWSSGLIEFGDEGTVPEGAIVIAHGEKASLRGVVEVLAKRGRGESAGLLLVPGVPEADTQEAKGDALAVWLKWCASGNGRKGRYGVLFGTEANDKARQSTATGA